jgi:hypothetical protein
MNKQILIGIAVGFLFLLWLMSYIGSGAYLRSEPFQAAVPAPNSFQRWGASVAPETPPVETVLEADKEVELPYEERPINSVDDYEYSAIFTNESDRPLTKAQRDKLMSQYPMDWSGYPPSSAQFQAGLRESFENATGTVPDDAKPYRDVNGAAMIPPDTGAQEMEERKLLMTYKPTFPPDPTAYDPADVNDLVTKVYAAKGLVPEIKQRGTSNVYDIVSTRRVGEKVLFEDELAGATGAPASESAVAAAGEGVTKAPVAAADSAANPDRFFEGNGGANKNKWDYTAWTPGLERMFAPNNEKSNWY